MSRMPIVCTLLLLAPVFARPAAAQDAASSATPVVAPIKVACVGDSITYGAGTAHASTDSYPAQLGRMLGSKYEVHNFGVSGTTLLKHGDKPYWNEAAYTNALAYQPDIVVIMLGTNDTKPQNIKFLDEFTADYKDLIEQFAKLPSKPHVYVGEPIPVVGKGAYGINEEGIQQERPLLKTIAKDEKATLVDLHKTLEKNPELIPDTVHPNNDGAGLLARGVYKALMGKKYPGKNAVLEPISGGAEPVSIGSGIKPQ